MYRIYVGNLPYRATEEDLGNFFASAGQVTEKVVPRTEDGRSKGFGFISFADEESYKNALAMNGQEMDGRALRINEARPREDRRPSDGNHNRETEVAEAEVSQDEASEE